MPRCLLPLALLLVPLVATAAEPPLRIFIRSGPKSHGPGAHDYPRFLAEWVPLLNSRGARAAGAGAFPTREQLEQTDVLILHAQEAGNIPAAEDRANLQSFLARGGGIIAIHAGAVSRDPDWFKSIVGGSWRMGTTKWLEGPMHLYFTDREHPITTGVSNWAMNDEIYYDMDLLPEIRVLATAYTPKPFGARNQAGQKRAEELTAGGKKVSIYDIQPQMWTYERTVAGGTKPSRAFVSLPGHLYVNFERPNYRALLLRGIAWAGQRRNVDELCRPEELGDALRYPADGPTHPAQAAARIEVHPEFKLSLVAAEPLINKVLNLDWDAQGRLWVCESPEYPNGRRAPNTAPWKDSGSLRGAQVQRDPEDRISILTDSDGDGVMDRKHVFADKLELVTSFVFYKTGVIAATAPDIWFLDDTDGDGVADRRTKLYTGLGIFDTHAVINNLRWGLDGWIYATHGYSSGDVTALGSAASSPPPPASPATPPRRAPASPTAAPGTVRISSGVVRFKPDGSQIEQYSSRGGNTWGLETTWDGQVFWTQPTSGTVFFHTLLPESVLARGKVSGTTSWKGMIVNQRSYPLMEWPEQAYVQIDQVGRFTAASGCAIYEGGAWPDKWHYSYFTTDPTINIVHHQFVRPEGVSYTTARETGREETEFIRSRDLWFRPIETRIGPDGALYVVDFYNQAVIHNDTRGTQHSPANAAIRPDRDHYFARIWRVQHQEARQLTVPALAGRDLPALRQILEASPNAHVKKTAWRLALENHGASAAKSLADLPRPPLGSKAQQRYEAARGATSPAQRQAVLAEFASATDDWTRSALVAAASEHAVDYLSLALAAPNAPALASFVSALLPAIAVDRAPQLVQACANAPATAGPLKSVVLRGLAQLNTAPAYLDAPTTRLLQRLLTNPETFAAAVPLIARWDRTGTLVAAAEPVLRQMMRDLLDRGQTDARRAEIAASLLTLPKSRPEALREIGGLFVDPAASPALKDALAAVLGDAPGTDTTAVLVQTFTRTKSAAAFDQLLRRPDSSLGLLAALQAGKVNLADLGPGNLARLRTHPNRRVAREAADLLAALHPQTRQKDELIAKLTPEVEKPGDLANGKALFNAACAICHKFGDLGVRDVGPPLIGMGAHGPAELLAHIIDPNREVDPSFWQWNITTQQGETLVGVIASENAASLTLRNQGGDTEVRKADLASRENTRRSLMPEGLEGLGAEGLRDLLAFMCAGEQNFRVLDLRDAYTADSRRGMFRREEDVEQSVSPHRFGHVTVAGVPFFIMDPARSPNGRSVVTLKGGPGTGNFSEEFPQRVAIHTTATAASLHFLGGVGGWAWPYGGDRLKDLPTLKVVVLFADGTREEFILKNGEHFADYNGRAAVPLSADAGDLVRRGQLRYFGLNLSKKATLKQVVLESFDNDISPVTVAVTASSSPIAHLKSEIAESPKAGGKNDRPLPPTEEVRWEAGKTRVLLIGGGSSHKFAEFFGTTDGATLRAAGFTVHYTEDRDQATAALAGAEVAVVSVNRMFFDLPAYRQALFAFAAAGKGLVLLHPGTWYAYPRWPEFNAQLVGGGARGHDKLGPFSVHVLQADHPIMRGVPAKFEVVDELYYLNAEPEKIPSGTAPIEVLAETSPSVKFKQPHPAVWITRHDRARIVGLTLGHDERVHDHPAFQAILRNAVRWVSRK